MSITIKSNIGEVTQAIKEKLAKLTDKENIPRILAFDTIDLMTKRIHGEGKATDEGQIGTYNKSYLKLRESKYGRKEGNKVVVSLTRNLEQHWSVIATEKGYGVGFIDPLNYKKARWVESNKGRIIFSLSGSEISHITDTVKQLTEDAFK